jgi:hypothetical protein
MPDTPFDAEHTLRLNRLADYLAAVPPEHLVMSAWFSDHASGAAMQLAESFGGERLFPSPEAAVADCGTAACVAGQAAALFQLRAENERDWGPVVAEYLGLNKSQEKDLFLPSGYEAHGAKPGDWAFNDFDPEAVRDLFTPANAARAVRELAETGGVPQWWCANSEVMRADGDEDGIQND